MGQGRGEVPVKHCPNHARALRLEVAAVEVVCVHGVAHLSEHTHVSHADLSPTTQNWPFSVLGFCEKKNGICAGVMPYRRDFPATTRI